MTIRRTAAEVRDMEAELNRSPEVQGSGLRVRLEAVDEPKVKLSRHEGSDPQGHDRAEMRALGRTLAAQDLAEDTARAWQGLPDPDEPRELTEAEQIGLETARGWGAQVE